MRRRREPSRAGPARRLAALFVGWTPFELGWLAVFTAVNLYLYAAWDESVLGLVTALTGMMSVVLVAKGRISNYWFGIVNVSLYSFTAWRNAYFGEVMLNLGYFLPMQFVGLYLWSRHAVAGRGAGEGEGTVDDVEVRWLGWRQRGLWLAVSVAGTAGYALVLEALGGNLPLLDAASTVLSVLAMLLMVQRVGEQWVLWIAVDVVSIYMWAWAVGQGARDASMVVMWSAYLVNAVYGLWNWLRLAERQERERREREDREREDRTGAPAAGGAAPAGAVPPSV